VIDDPDARMTHADVRSFWEEAVRVTGDEALGLHLGQQVRPAAYDALGYVFRTSATLGDGLERLARYHRFLDDAVTLKIERQGERARVVLSPLPSRLLSRASADFQLAALVQSARAETGTPDLSPLEVEFAIVAPADDSEHRRLFQSPVRFGCAANACVLALADLARPLRGAERELREVLERRVRDVIARLPPTETVSARARSMMGEDLGSPRTTASALGRLLGLSERSLHRRLQAEGTTFRALLQEVRREQAERYIREGVPLIEVAFLLGYSESSAFHRSFKQWTGRTPSAYRKEVASSATRTAHTGQ
jgi:AraC-like DNA-binding protein